jgi:hypothetical protein
MGMLPLISRRGWKRRTSTFFWTNVIDEMALVKLVGHSHGFGSLQSIWMVMGMKFFKRNGPKVVPAPTVQGRRCFYSRRKCGE